MKLISLIITLSYFTIALSQVEETSGLNNNQSITKVTLDKKEKNINSFDSTYIYIYDTLDIPILDEFSTDKYQKYNANFNDPDVSSTLHFRLIDNITSTPINKNIKFSSLITYRRIYSIDKLSYIDQPFTPIKIKVADLNYYPVNYKTIDAYPPYYINEKNSSVDTVWQISPDLTQDSARQFFKNINDVNSIWIDNYTYHNYRYAIKPWTIGVATFDGINENGKAYELDANISNYADYLTSKPINLSTYSSSDSLFLSFLYQSGGFGEEPDVSDSIILEFYDLDLKKWLWIWGDTGTSDKTFKVGHIHIKNTNFLKKGFQFRFKNYGNLAGGFDIFNVDYIRLRADSYKGDTLFKDYSWVYPINTLIKEYTAVPWDHYKNNKLNKISENVRLDIRNGSNIYENNTKNGKIEILYNNILEGSFLISGSSLSGGILNYEPRTFYSTIHNLSGGYEFDISKIGTKAKFTIRGTIDADFNNLKTNDTTYSEQYFGNYYSYDDGSAEAAYGLIGSQSDLAIQFTPYETDSLIGIMTNFVESGNNVSEKLFLLTIWSDNNGKPDKIIYKDNAYFPRTPKYNNGINNFYTYYFENNQKIKIDGKFYIGWKQISSERLNIGFDKNNINNNKTFYSLNNGSTWTNSSVEGTVMMRPLYSTSMDLELGIEEQKNEEDVVLTIFPNPTNNLITIKQNSKEYLGVEIYNIQGKLILTSKENQIDLSNNPAGIYILKMIGFNSKNQKIIKY